MVLDTSLADRDGRTDELIYIFPRTRKLSRWKVAQRHNLQPHEQMIPAQHNPVEISKML
jgi:hypothetical protein